MKRITQQDLARRLGLSRSLVSRALSGTAEAIGIRPDTVARVRREAERHGYWPNSSARRLRGADPATLALVISDLEDPFFGPVVAEFLRQSHRAGYAATLVGLENRVVEPRDLAVLLGHDLSGVVVIGSGEHSWTAEFRRRKLPMVCIGHAPPRSGLTCVSVDEQNGMTQIARHLAALGHRQIGFIGADVPIHRKRFERVSRELRNRRCPAPAAGFGTGSVLDAGESAVAQLMENLKGRVPTAIVASSDAVAMGALRELDRRGLRVPQDVSLTGFDDLALARLSVPPLTSVRQPVPLLVGEALRIVIHGGPGVELEPELVVRASTAEARP